MQIEKILINDCLSVSKVSWKFRIPNGIIHGSKLGNGIIHSALTQNISKNKHFLPPHSVERGRIGSYSGPHFYFVSLRIQSKCGKIRGKCGPEQLRIRTLFTQCLIRTFTQKETNLTVDHNFAIKLSNKWGYLKTSLLESALFELLSLLFSSRGGRTWTLSY